ncbi:MAG: hypothetical protein GF329_07375, partial [Candidatus Lokiarchaeota archaeon]|nr:hypothetical protein [Candidatus Lokiarchaeota archaeon]
MSSNPLKVDSDGDGLSDWKEYQIWIENGIGLDPMDPDTNNNGISDYNETVGGIKLDSDGDGLTDLEELQTTNTDPERSDTDEDGLSDSEEVYPGDDGYITDPNCNDSDNDGLLDSAESYSIVKEYGARKRIDPDSWRAFSFDAVIGSTAVNATLSVSISVGEESGSNPANLTTEVYLNEEIIFQNYTENRKYFSNMTAIKNVVDENIGTYSGTWKLKVYSTENCMLEEFKVEVTQRLNPNNPDCDGDGLLAGHEMSAEYNGWATNPKAADSDGDGWNDYYEIVIKETNPLSKDTDGDKVPDPQDIDPLKNLIIKIMPMEGHSGTAYKCSPVLSMVIEVNDRVVVTPHKRANKDPEVKQKWGWTWYWMGWFWGEWRYEVKKEWTIDTTAEFKDSGTGDYYAYYMDVPDDKSENRLEVQSRLWSFHFWLTVCDWPLIRTASRIVDRTSHYYVQGDGHSQTFRRWSGSSWLKYRIETKGLERVNTIAVYQNGSFYDDHYPSIERMNVITLEVTNTGAPFVQGINVILIPTN